VLLFLTPILSQVLAGLENHIRQIKANLTNETAGIKAELQELASTIVHVPRDVATPLLLRMRRPATVDVFSHQFQLRPELAEDFPILSLFLAQEGSICAHRRERGRGFRGLAWTSPSAFLHPSVPSARAILGALPPSCTPWLSGPLRPRCAPPFWRALSVSAAGLAQGSAVSSKIV
jgi:hypothetical protein